MGYQQTWPRDVAQIRDAAAALERHDRPAWASSLREMAGRIEAEHLQAERAAKMAVRRD